MVCRSRYYLLDMTGKRYLFLMVVISYCSRLFTLEYVSKELKHNHSYCKAMTSIFIKLSSGYVTYTAKVAFTLKRRHLPSCMSWRSLRSADCPGDLYLPVNLAPVLAPRPTSLSATTPAVGKYPLTNTANNKARHRVNTPVLKDRPKIIYASEEVLCEQSSSSLTLIKMWYRTGTPKYLLPRQVRVDFGRL